MAQLAAKQTVVLVVVREDLTALAPLAGRRLRQAAPISGLLVAVAVAVEPTALMRQALQPPLGRPAATTTWGPVAVLAARQAGLALLVQPAVAAVAGLAVQVASVRVARAATALSGRRLDRVVVAAVVAPAVRWPRTLPLEELAETTAVAVVPVDGPPAIALQGLSVALARMASSLLPIRRQVALFRLALAARPSLRGWRRQPLLLALGHNASS